MSKNRREPLVFLFCILAVVNIFWFGYLLINKANDEGKIIENNAVVEDTEKVKETEDVKETEEIKENEGFKEIELIVESEFYYNQLQIDQKEGYFLLYQGLMEQNPCIMITECTGEDLGEIWNAVLSDHPEIFWVDGYSFCEWENEITECEVMPDYIYTKEEIYERQTKIKEFVVEFVDGLSLEASDYEKILYTYETLINQTEYDINSLNNQHIDSILIDKRTVCSGYAKATKLLLNCLGVECIYVTGFATNSEETDRHAWNIVNCEGEYFFVDTTWGDPRTVLGVERLEEIEYSYLCCNEEQLFLTHEMNSAYEYPSCTALDWNYYVVNGCYFTEYDAEKIRQLIRRDIENDKNVSYFKFSNSNLYNEAKEDLINVLISEGRKYKNEIKGTENKSNTYVDNEQNNLFKIYW